MELLISMKAEPLERGLEPMWRTMSVPGSQSNGYFIAEFREPDPINIDFLKRLAIALAGKLEDSSDFIIEPTLFGFAIKKSVDKNIEYMQAWEKWVIFSRKVYDKLEEIIIELRTDTGSG